MTVITAGEIDNIVHICLRGNEHSLCDMVMNSDLVYRRHIQLPNGYEHVVNLKNLCLLCKEEIEIIYNLEAAHE